MSHTKVLKINLLPGASRLQVKAIRYRWHNKVISVVILVVWIVLTILAFVVSAVMNGSLKKNQAELDLKNSSYQKYKDVVLTTNKLRFLTKQVGDILATRFEYAQTFENFSKLYDPNVFAVENFELKNKKIFSVKGSISLFDGQLLLEKLIADINDGKIEGFGKAVLNSLNWQKDAGWSFSMEVEI